MEVMGRLMRQDGDLFNTALEAEVKRGSNAVERCGESGERREMWRKW